MSIRGNSSLNIKFTQIDSKFSSTFSVHWSGEFRFCVSTIFHFCVHQLLTTPIFAEPVDFRVRWFPSPLISESVDFRVRWFPSPLISESVDSRVRWFPSLLIPESVDFRDRWFLSPSISESVDFRVQGIMLVWARGHVCKPLHIYWLTLQLNSHICQCKRERSR